MTKREHEALQKEFNKMSEYDAEADVAFKRLQDLNGTEGTGHRWCCAAQNYRDLLSKGKDYTYIYDQYVEANGKRDAMMDLGRTLAGLNFWKKKQADRR